jgi:hypothetical protein
MTKTRGRPILPVEQRECSDLAREEVSRIPQRVEQAAEAFTFVFVQADDETYGICLDRGVLLGQHLLDWIEQTWISTPAEAEANVEKVGKTLDALLHAELSEEDAKICSVLFLCLMLTRAEPDEMLRFIAARGVMVRSAPEGIGYKLIERQPTYLN